MPYQIFKIVRPPEETTPITAKEIKQWLSHYRQSSEWEVIEVGEKSHKLLLGSMFYQAFKPYIR